MYTLPTEPHQSLGAVLDDGFRLFRASWRRLLPLAFLCALIGVLPSALLSNLPLADTPSRLQALGLMGAIFVVTMTLTLVTYGTLLAGVDEMARTGTINLGNALRTGLRRAPALVGAGFLATLAMTIGFVLLIVPGIWLSVALCLAYMLPVVEGLGPVASCTRSRELVTGSWWRTAGVISVLVIIMLVLSLIASLIVVLVMTPFVNKDNAATMTLGINLVAALLWAPFLPLTYCLIYGIYTDLRLRKDGSDLLARAGATGV